MDTSTLFYLIGAGLAAIGCLGGGIGIGIAAGHAADATSRQPEASGKIMTIFILGAALAEATSIYALVVALMIVLK
jgi:F-type H+-transporting ATPase subunit c